MPDTGSAYSSMNGKRRILLVEDETVNREILLTILQDSYEVITAESGQDAIEKLYTCRETLSLILLDLILPDIHGLDILVKIKGDPLLSGIPVIVMTADREAEVESLNLGAIDFIPKPYPLPKVILARVHRAIESSENRDIIRLTERDGLTGLYNKEYFFGYAEQMDAYHGRMPMDALVVNINRFRLINERYGKAFGNEILRQLADKICSAVGPDAIVCRREGDIFLIYLAHRDDYAALFSRISEGMDSRVHIRMGVYPNVDKRVDIERRFDRAKTAADSIRSSFTQSVAVYDSALHESELFAAQLLEDFPKALQEKQFLVYYQPKFDIRPEVPLLNSSEALVRWKHPALGMINPGVFIPLFESNGLIQQLDRYVWHEAAAQMRDWKTRLGVCLPVSVNVSRVDLFDPDLLQNLQGLLEEFELSPAEFLLEITESAYTEDSAHIIKTVNRLREAGFSIEMDDFGSGYSSLNMLTTLPVDVLKLDMQFLRNAFRERKNTKVLEVVIDIADSLQVSTVAEGVETAEQLLTLKSIGCDIGQGYLFSRPIPAGEYERFLIARRDTPDLPHETPVRRQRAHLQENFAYDALHDPATGLYNESAYEIFMRDIDPEHTALLILTLDDYELIKARYGKVISDRAVERAAEALHGCFRSADYVCRIGKDEFVVIVTRIESSRRNVIEEKVARINEELGKPEDGLPLLSLSAGIAFADREHTGEALFRSADAELNRVKEQKRFSRASR